MKKLDKIIEQALQRLEDMSAEDRSKFLADQQDRFGGQIPRHEDVYILGGLRDIKRSSMATRQ